MRERVVYFFDLKFVRDLFKSFSLIMIFFFLLNACSSNREEHTESPSAANQLRMTTGASPQSLDPHIIAGQPGYTVASALFEPLLSMDFNSFEVQPGVAERWQVSEDGLVYQFYLREQARWSNGEPVTADDFVAAFNRIFSPKLGNRYVGDFASIKNSQFYYQGELQDFSQVGVIALSDHILQIVLDTPDPLMLRKLAIVNTAPVNRASILAHGALADPLNPWTDADKMVVNGPFTLQEWTLNKHIIVKKNSHYWDSNSIKLDSILFNLADTESAEERMFRAGQVDLTFGSRIPVAKIATYKKEAPNSIVSKTAYATYYYKVNVEKPPLDNRLVREALSSAINRQLLIDSVLKNEQSPALAMGLEVGGYTPPTIQPFDVKQAQKALADAGYPNGEGFPGFTLLFNTSEAHLKVATAIQQMWEKHLNIQVKLQNMEWKVFLDELAGGRFDVARSGFFSTLGDPVDILGSYITGHGMNHTGWANHEYDRLIEQSNGLPGDSEERFKLLAQAEKILLDDLPVIPIFYYKNTYLISPRVKGFEFNMSGVPIFKGVYLDPLH